MQPKLALFTDGSLGTTRDVVSVKTSRSWDGLKTY